MNKFITTLLILVILGSCEKPVTKDSYRPISIKTNKYIAFDEIVNNIDICQLETKENCLINNIRKFLIWQNRIFIFDRKQKSIFIFDNHGTFINKIHNVGKGANEYSMITDFTINHCTNNIEFVDGYCLHSYSIDGEFINKIRIANKKMTTVNELEVLDDDIIVFLCRSHNNKAAYYSRKQKRFLEEFQIYPLWIKEKMPFNSNDRLYKNGTIINYLEGFSNKVYSLDSKGFALSYEWDFGSYNFDYSKPPLKDLIKKYSIQDIMKHDDIFTRQFAVVFKHNIENESHIITNFLFKGKPTTLIFNKINDKYLLLEKDISTFIYFSKIQFNAEGHLLITAEPGSLKNLPQKLFSKSNLAYINRMNELDNPVILNIDITYDKIK